MVENGKGSTVLMPLVMRESVTKHRQRITGQEIPDDPRRYSSWPVKTTGWIVKTSGSRREETRHSFPVNIHSYSRRSVFRLCSHLKLKGNFRHQRYKEQGTTNLIHTIADVIVPKEAITTTTHLFQLTDPGLLMSQHIISIYVDYHQAHLSRSLWASTMT